ncbi:MAG TPA: hypothetical protein VLP43_07300 [Solirubrobacteraceae bacterium]|nr:hypothetical protein [Solirubrobacteraceae bacterium]
MDWVTISSLATAGGTLVLAIATFSSVRSANRSARVAEQSLLVGLRPVLVPSKEDDPMQRVGFGDGRRVDVHGHGGTIQIDDGAVYMAIALRNGGQGLAVIHGWHAHVPPPEGNAVAPDPEDFRRQQIDLYIPAGDTGYWQGAIRDPGDPQLEPVRRAVREGTRVLVDLLYGDHEGGQRTMARFSLVDDDDPAGRRALVLRYWNLDRADPR